MDLVEEVKKLYEEKNWRKITELFHDHPQRNKLLWVYPSADNLQFIQSSLGRLCCDRILSIGCGSGLLEWMICEATGIPASGLEVDSKWWLSKHAPPTFIPLLFTPPTLDKDAINLLQKQSTALLFCYFNNRKAFEEYLRHYLGHVLIIIGPHCKAVHTDPRPFEKICDDWDLFDSQEVRDSKDFIAIYHRKK